ncbi:MAG: hypothetical protein ACM3O3_11460 [Syntrophothermus sp.]
MAIGFMGILKLLNNSKMVTDTVSGLINGYKKVRSTVPLISQGSELQQMLMYQKEINEKLDLQLKVIEASIIKMQEVVKIIKILFIISLILIVTSIILVLTIL